MPGHKAIGADTLVAPDIVAVRGPPTSSKNVFVVDGAVNKDGALSIPNTRVFFSGQPPRRFESSVAGTVATQRRHPALTSPLFIKGLVEGEAAKLELCQAG